MIAAPERPTSWRLIAFALPASLSWLLHTAVSTVTPTLYATHFGLSLAGIGAAMLFARAFDAISDPAIGQLSDRTRGSLGRRKPWLIASAPLTMISAWFLFDPPPRPSLLYFFLCYAAIYFAWTLAEIPHLAWGAEITRDYRQRSRVFAFRLFAQFLGIMAFFLLPLLSLFPAHQVTPDTLRFIARLVLVAAPLLVLIAVLFGPPSLADTKPAEQPRLRDLIGLLRGNAPFRIYLAGFLLAGLAEGMFGSVTFLYFTIYLGLAGSFSLLLGLAYASALAFTPFVPRIASRFGKHRVWAFSNGLGVLVFLSILLVPPRAVLPIALLVVPIGFANAVTNIIAPSVLGDVIDYDALKSGKRRAGSYTALHALVWKFNQALGGSVAFFLLGLFGFDARLGLANGSTAMLGLKLAYIAVPSLIYAGSVVYISLFPINRRRQTLIARRLADREARESGTAGPLPA